MVASGRPAGILSGLPRALPLALALLAAPGCITVGPDYRPPEPELPGAWSETVPAPAGAEAAPGRDVAEWWTIYEDPAIDRLVEEARKGNLDLAAAAARVEAARAMVGVAAGGARPELDAEGSVDRRVAGGYAGSTDPVDGFDLRGSFSWELDLFGRIRRTVEAARADLGAATADRNGVLVSLTADTVRLVILARTKDEQLRQAERILTRQRESLEVNRTRRKYGLASDLAVSQAEQVTLASAALLPRLRMERAQAFHALAVLLGRTPGEEIDVGEGPASLPEVAIDPGIPAELLRRRPDVIAAERKLAAQVARVGVATADLYPSLSLSGFVGLAASGGADLFDRDAFNWKVVLPLKWKLLSGGRVRRSIEAERARAEAALAEYQQTVLEALQEVEDALAAVRETRKRVEMLALNRKSAERTLHLFVWGFAQVRPAPSTWTG